MGQHKIDTVVKCVKLSDRPIHVAENYKFGRYIGAVGTVEDFVDRGLLNREKGMYHVVVNGKITAFWADEIKKIAEPTEFWYCPNCKYRITNLNYKMAMKDYFCRCGVHRLSFFNPVAKEVKK